MKYPILITATCAALVSTAPAATNFTNADVANELISNALNWDNGLPIPSGEPPVANPGTLSIAARFDTTVIHTGYNVVHSDGLLSLIGTGALRLSGSTWLMNGTATTNSRGLQLNDSSTFEIALGSGTAAFNNNTAVDITVATSSSLTVTSGNLSVGRNLVANGATFTMDSPGNVTFSIAGVFGTGGLGSNGIINLNAGTIAGGTFTRFVPRAGTDVNFGGTTVGSATFSDWGTGVYTNTGDRARDNDFTLNFKSASRMTLTLGEATRALDFTNDSVSNPTTLAWAQALWERGQLIYTDGATVVSGFDPDPETNGWTILTWADATNSGVGFGTASSEYFNWTAGGSFGGSLTLAPASGEGDVTPPTWTATWPQVDAVGATTFTARAKTDENGTAYYVVLADGATAPNAAEVKAGTAAGGGSALANGSISLTANTENTTAVTGLTDGTAYDVYFVAQDAVPNLQASPSKVDVTTLTFYEDWADGAAFGEDANSDGVDNGLAFLLGADTPTSAVTLPAVSNDSGKLVLTFSMRNSANRGTATLSVQHSSDLGIGDPWSAGATVPTNGDGVTFNVTPGSPLDIVIAEISSSEAASGKLFGRLKALP